MYGVCCVRLPISADRKTEFNENTINNAYLNVEYVDRCRTNQTYLTFNIDVIM